MAGAVSVQTAATSVSDRRWQQRSPSVVFLSPTGQIGGAERVLIDMIAGMRARDPLATITLVASADGPLLPVVRETGARVVVLPFPSSLATLGDAQAGSLSGTVGVLLRALRAIPDVLRYRASLRSLLNRERPDVIHTNGAKMHLLGALAGSDVAPVVWHLHDYPGSRRVMRRALKASVSRVALLIANSESVARDARAVFGPDVSVRTVLNGVDTARFTPVGDRLDLDALSGMAAPDGDVVRIGLVATYAKWKGHELFFRALGALPATAAWRCYVVGGPVYETQGSQWTRGELQKMAAAAGMADRVGFTGLVTDVPSALRALDVVVHASTLPEPFGLVIAEALACGRPVVTSGSGGAIEVAGAGSGATVVRTNDATALAATIARLIESPMALGRAGENARGTAVSRFDRDSFVAAIVDAHDAVLVHRAR